MNEPWSGEDLSAYDFGQMIPMNLNKKTKNKAIDIF